MAAWRAALLIALFIAATDRCAAEDVEEFPDSQLTHEQWQHRLDEAKRRTESFVEKLRSQPSQPFVPEREQQEIADHRAMRDQTLRQGDIVSTSRGLFIYTGRDNDSATGAFRRLEPGQRNGAGQSSQHPHNR
jgi:hypothetical protein